MTRDELTEECVQAFGQAWHATPEGVPGDRRRAGIAAIEPLIRADERKRVAMDINYRMLARAVVANDHHAYTERDLWVLAADISRSFALLDGSSDD